MARQEQKIQPNWFEAFSCLLQPGFALCCSPPKAIPVRPEPLGWTGNYITITPATPSNPFQSRPKFLDGLDYCKQWFNLQLEQWICFFLDCTEITNRILLRQHFKIAPADAFDLDPTQIPHHLIRDHRLVVSKVPIRSMAR